MNNRRTEIMRELGLTPVWRRREQAAAEPSAEREAPVDSAPVPAELQAPAAPRAVSEPAPRAGGVSPEVNDPGRRDTILGMEWPALRECVAHCAACPLHQRRNKTVFGVGDEHADWMFVGEGPGADEDATGEPFVGQAGRLLDNMLAALHMNRASNVYIANVVKCRPPGNRNPEPAESSACEPYLTRQIALIQPRLIVALGKVAAQALLGNDHTIASMRGRLHDYRGTPLIVTYHPAYLLRTPLDKAKAWADLCFARETIEQQIAATKPSGD